VPIISERLKIKLSVNSANKYFVLFNIIALLSTVNQQSIYNDKSWLSVYYYALMSIFASNCWHAMNAVEIPQDFVVFLVIWPSHLETELKPKEPTCSRYWGKNQTKLELKMPKYVEVERNRTHKREEPKPNQYAVVWFLVSSAHS